MGPVASRIRIEFSEARYGLRAEVHGVNDTLDTTLQYWQAIAAQVRRSRPAGVLVVDAMQGEPPPLAGFHRVASAMQGLGMEHVRVAYVELHPQQIPRSELAMIMINEQGFSARVFDSEHEAIRWLRYGER